MQAPRLPQSQQERLEQLEKENRQLQRQVEQGRFKNKRLKKRLERLEQDLEKARRAIHRQAAPFSLTPLRSLKAQLSLLPRQKRL